MRLYLLPLLISASLILIGAGCAPATSLNLTTAAPSAPTSVGSTVRPEEKQPYYVTYSDANFQQARSEGRPILLYFWAGWCPICRAEEPLVKQRIEQSGLPIAGFRVNFDSEEALKAQYRITYQHTTVILNSKGVETDRFFGPISDVDSTTAFKKAASE